MAIFESRNVCLIKLFLLIDFRMKKLEHELNCFDYPLEKKGHRGLVSNNVLKREHELIKEKLKKYEESIKIVSKDNISLLYKKAGEILPLMIISFFTINIFYIIKDFFANFSITEPFSFPMIASYLIIIIFLSKILIFMMSYNKDYATELFQQDSRNNKGYAFMIIIIIIINSYFRFLSFVELFGLLYVFSYIFNLIYETNAFRKTKQPNP